jgi:RNA 2',3'-cyclic 3'-phosphodiesterase
VSDLIGIRSFIALDTINKDAIEKLQQELSEHRVLRDHEVKPVKSQNLHFTIIFLSEVDMVTIEKIKYQLSELDFEPIKITYSGIGGFPSLNSASVIWLGVDEQGKSKMISLAKCVISKMKDLGFILDKPFSPHMTILRVKKGKLRATELFSAFSTRNFGNDVIDKLALKSSNLTPYGPVYSDIFVVHAK